MASDPEVDRYPDALLWLVQMGYSGIAKLEQLWGVGYVIASPKTSFDQWDAINKKLKQF